MLSWPRNKNGMESWIYLSSRNRGHRCYLPPWTPVAGELGNRLSCRTGEIPSCTDIERGHLAETPVEISMMGRMQSWFPAFGGCSKLCHEPSLIAQNPGGPGEIVPFCLPYLPAGFHVLGHICTWASFVYCLIVTDTAFCLFLAWIFKMNHKNHA